MPAQWTYSDSTAEAYLGLDFQISPDAIFNFRNDVIGFPIPHISAPPQGKPGRGAPESKEHPQVASNNRAYEVILTSGDVRIIEANEVEEANGRLKFTGQIQGYEDYARQGETVASFLAESVAEYHVVPVAQEAKVGANTYEIAFTKGGTTQVQADRVLHTKGSDKSPGQFTFVTSLRNGEVRTEFLVGEDKVETIKRVTATGDVSVPAQDGDKATATASAAT